MKERGTTGSSGDDKSDATNLNPKVSVIDSQGTKLPATRASRARRLLVNGRAEVYERHPFTIRLLDKQVNVQLSSGYKDDEVRSKLQNAAND